MSEKEDWEAGRAMDTVVPMPCPRLETVTVPPLDLTKVEAIQKPSPDPGTLACRRSLRNERRPSSRCSSGVMPTPSSVTERIIQPGSAWALIDMVDPDGEYLAAVCCSCPQASSI